MKMNEFLLWLYVVFIIIIEYSMIEDDEFVDGVDVGEGVSA